MLLANSAVIVFGFLVFVFMPALGVYSYFYLKKGKPLRPKPQRYLVSMGFMVLLFFWTLRAADVAEVRLFPARYPDAVAWIFGGVFVLAILVRIWRGWEKIPAARQERMRLLLPEKPAHLPYWIVISLLAGLVEETAYRGVAYRLVFWWTGSLLLTLCVCVAAFGVAHAAQGWRAVLGVGIFGLLFHMMVLLTGSLYLAMVTHAVYDLALGILVMKKLRAEPEAPLNPAPTAPGFNSDSLG